MKSALISFLTEAEYLEAEKRAEQRSDYVDGVRFPVSEDGRRHNSIVGNTLIALGGPARARGYKVNTISVKLRIESRRSYYYPDVILSCRDEPDDYFVSQPCAVFEVESRETALVDRREKRQAYITLDSLREYVILAQDEIAATVYRRAATGDGWIEEQLGPGDQLHISCLALDLTLDSLYDDL